jgi:hypothetical protein
MQASSTPCDASQRDAGEFVFCSVFIVVFVALLQVIDAHTYSENTWLQASSTPCDASQRDAGESGVLFVVSFYPAWLLFVVCLKGIFRCRRYRASND